MSKRFGLSVLTIAISLVVSATAQAKQKQGLLSELSGQGYGTAGCGLGSVLFGAQPGKVQIFAAFTNNFYGNQSFGITSGTLNCDIPKMGQQAAAFIETNKEVVMKEAARGNGETVSALSSLLNCNESALATDLKSNFDFYFGQKVDSYESVRRMLKSGNCSIKG